MNKCSNCAHFAPYANSNAGECRFMFPPFVKVDTPPVVRKDDTCSLHSPKG